ncbi:MAG: hypothetical protein ACKO54_07395, partial [Alphaproteobacteria bacterium]
GPIGSVEPAVLENLPLSCLRLGPDPGQAGWLITGVLTDSLRVLALLENPPAPNEKLRRASQVARKII